MRRTSNGTVFIRRAINRICKAVFEIGIRKLSKQHLKKLYSRTGNVVLYVVVDQNKIPLSTLTEIKKTEVVKTPALQKQSPEASRSVAYNIAQIIEFVNSGDLLRYVPDEMLTEAQKITKYEAIAKTIEKTNAKNDERYLEFITILIFSLSSFSRFISIALSACPS